MLDVTAGFIVASRLDRSQPCDLRLITIIICRTYTCAPMLEHLHYYRIRACKCGQIKSEQLASGAMLRWRRTTTEYSTAVHYSAARHTRSHKMITAKHTPLTQKQHTQPHQRIIYLECVLANVFMRFCACACIAGGQCGHNIVYK